MIMPSSRKKVRPDHGQQKGGQAVTILEKAYEHHLKDYSNIPSSYLDFRALLQRVPYLGCCLNEVLIAIWLLRRKQRIIRLPRLTLPLLWCHKKGLFLPLIQKPGGYYAHLHFHQDRLKN